MWYIIPQGSHTKSHPPDLLVLLIHNNEEFSGNPRLHVMPLHRDHWLIANSDQSPWYWLWQGVSEEHKPCHGSSILKAKGRLEVDTEHLPTELFSIRQLSHKQITHGYTLLHNIKISPPKFISSTFISQIFNITKNSVYTVIWCVLSNATQWA